MSYTQQYRRGSVCIHASTDRYTRRQTNEVNRVEWIHKAKKNTTTTTKANKKISNRKKIYIQTNKQQNRRRRCCCRFSMLKWTQIGREWEREKEMEWNKNWTKFVNTERSDDIQSERLSRVYSLIQTELKSLNTLFSLSWCKWKTNKQRHERIIINGKWERENSIEQ